ncbi:GGDEF domain-containing protein [Microvirga arabica]|uniref:diguanylate cyclase n=1 Tax=Microvirga arabica TaxID=1128671 RepID=A0ABV6Y7R0_9HYPH
MPFDEQDRLQYANAVYRGIFLGGREGSFTLSELLRYGFEHRTGTVIKSGDVEAFIADLYTRRRKIGPHQAFETDLMDGRWFFMNQTVLPNGWILIVGTDITALKHNEKTLRQAAETDPLTGLANRRRMFSLLDRALARMATEPFCLALVDIDRFKGINDRFGHPAGDTVLKHFADRVRHRLGTAGSFGRIGGEEFILLLPGLDIGEAERRLHTLCADIPPLPLGSGRSSIVYTASAGLTAASASDSAEAIVHRADQALYLAKAAGRDRVTTLTRETELAGRIA